MSSATWQSFDSAAQRLVAVARDRKRHGARHVGGGGGAGGCGTGKRRGLWHGVGGAQRSGGRSGDGEHSVVGGTSTGGGGGRQWQQREWQRRGRVAAHTLEPLPRSTAAAAAASGQLTQPQVGCRRACCPTATHLLPRVP